MTNETTTIDKALLETIKGVHVEYCGSVPESYTSDVQRFIENWIYEAVFILIEPWRIADALKADPEISNAEAQRRAVVELGHLEFLKTLENDNLSYDSVAVSPIS